MVLHERNQAVSNVTPCDNAVGMENRHELASRVLGYVDMAENISLAR